MKKSLIVVIVIAILVLGVLTFLRPQRNIQDATNQARSASVAATLKSFVAYSMTDSAQYYGDSKNTAPYWPAHKQNLDDKFIQLVKSRNDGQFDYKVFDEKENTAVKAADTSRNIYVCMDSLTVEITDITADEFTKNTDCSGQVIK